MSLSLLTRRLPGLKIAQRAVVQTMPAKLTLPDGNCGNLTSTYLVTVPPQMNCPLATYTRSPLILQRHFSSLNFSSDAIDDDGGSVTPIDASLSSMTNAELAEMSTIPGWNLVHNPPRRNTPRGALVGKVVSDKMQKTVNVAVDRYRIVPKYRKRLRYTKKFMAHDEHEVCNAGDLVMIVPCQKISRHKHFMVREIIRAKGQL
jgi:small subunit ribosomal protein S17